MSIRMHLSDTDTPFSCADIAAWHCASITMLFQMVALQDSVVALMAIDCTYAGISLCIASVVKGFWMKEANIYVLAITFRLQTDDLQTQSNLTK